MKSIYKLIIAITLTLGMLPSCQKLDIPPVSILTDEIMFKSEAGLNPYLAEVYRKLPIEDFSYRPGGRDGQPGFNLHHEWEHFWHSGAVTGEMVGPFGGMDIGGGFGYWPYKDIRAVNYLLQTLPVYASNFTEQRLQELIGEGHFLRAYYYFALAKRYGGIPIIKVVQNYPEQTIPELQVPRDTEDAVWEFIGEELDLAFEMMPESAVSGRANKYAAAALKSRAMLYAGCIAKYGSVNFVEGDARAQGFVGIPAEKAEGYFTKAWDAAKLIEGHYSLYNKTPADKVKNFTDIFLDKASPENIFVREYSITGRNAHSWNATFSPEYMTAGGLSRAYPTLDFVERFGLIDVTNADGTPTRYDNLAEIMQGLEPRLLGSVYFPGATLRGLEFDTQRGLYPSFSGTAEAEVAKQPDQRSYKLAGGTDAVFEGRRIIGFTGISTGGDNFTRTGFYVRKYINPALAKSEVNLFMDETPWIEFRYAEVLLNRAEAAAELNNTADVLTCLNMIRDRAGAPSTADASIANVRNERCKELAFENHYWWDLKRWRTADVVLDNARFKGLMPYYVMNENKYIFLKEPETFGRNYHFDKRFYYEPLPGGELGKNPNLYPNNPNY